MKLKNKHQASGDQSNDEILHAYAEFESLDEHVLKFKMKNNDDLRWELPLANKNPGKDYKPIALEKMGFKLIEDPFTFQVVCPVSGDVLIDTTKSSSGSLKFYDKYLEIGLRYAYKHAFGLGERVTQTFELCPKTEVPKWGCEYTIWNIDNANHEDEGKQCDHYTNSGEKGKNMYGSQPFYLIQLPRGDFMGVLFNNLNGQDIDMAYQKGSFINIYHKSIGGIIEFYFFFRGSPDLIIKKYHSLIGRPYVPPFWSLGFHLSHWGWKTTAHMREALQRMDDANIPIDVMWSDIDYMKDFADFTVDPVRFKGLGDLIKEFHNKGVRWVPIIDAGIKVDSEDPIYKKGIQQQSFIMSAVTKKALVGKVWPGLAVFPDWYSPTMTDLWHEGLGNLYKLAEFDGIWIDMNDVSNFVKGEVQEADKKLLRDLASYDPKNHDRHEYDSLPYLPGCRDPNDKTLSMTGYHHDSNEYEDRFLKEYNLHNIFCLEEAKATNSFIAQKAKKRPFVLTRSNVPGSGQYTSLWLGDNYSLWKFMRFSINGMYNYQMFGMPLVGADICGFIGDTEEKLCARWMQMGAFYPFSRNHNANNTIAQEPYILGDRVRDASRNALRQKYSLLWFYYTKIYEVSLYGGMVMRPLYFLDPYDSGAFAKNEHQFMIGTSVLVCPALDASIKDKTFPYVTNENWFDLFREKRVNSYDRSAVSGRQIEVPGGFDYVTLLLRGGSIVPFQNALALNVKRSDELKKLPMSLLIAADHNGVAAGKLIVDDGDSLDPIKTGQYRELEFSFSLEQKKLKVNVLHNYENHFSFEGIRYVTIYGAGDWSQMRYACIHLRDGTKLDMTAQYKSATDILTFTAYSTNSKWDAVAEVVFGAKC